MAFDLTIVLNGVISAQTQPALSRMSDLLDLLPTSSDLPSCQLRLLRKRILWKHLRKEVKLAGEPVLIKTFS